MCGIQPPFSETFADDPQDSRAIMNRFLTPLTNAILARNGTIDKYMGDAIMAFWNAPLDVKMHERDACEAALDMIERVDALTSRTATRNRLKQAFATCRSRWELASIRTLRGWQSGVGAEVPIHGDGEQRNLASRLEGQTALHGVADSHWIKNGRGRYGTFALLQVDSIRVRGKQEPDVIYTIVGRSDVAETSDFKSLRDYWAKMLVCYQKQDWSGT
jgi:adenylate cyclase